MVANICNKTAIVGIGATEFSKNSGRSETQLACEAVWAAVQDAGLDARDIEGATCFTMDLVDEVEIARGVGIGELKFYSRVPHGGGAATGLLHQAAMAVSTGMAEVVVCYRSLNGRSGQRYSEGVAGEIITPDLIHWGWYMPYGLLTPTSWVAMFTQRYMHKTGCTKEALCEVALRTREYAVKNPNAFFYQKPLTREQYYGARKIVEPLDLYDCCQESDGACATIVTTAERAKDLKQTPVYIRGVAQGIGEDQESMTSFYREDITRIPSMDIAARQVWEQCGLSAKDIDAAIIYDAFTSIVLWQLESWGFCEYGAAEEFVKGGTLAIDGRLPTNTHGGQLSEAYIHGMNGVNEGVRLVRGTSANQPKKNVDHVLVTSGVGVPTGGMVLGK